MKRFYIKTFGCQMNTADSERLAAGLETQGCTRAEKMEDADLIIINTCSVRQAAEDKVYGLAPKVRRLKGENCPPAGEAGKLKIVVTGCMVGSATGERRRTKLADLKRRMTFVDEFTTIENLVKRLPLCGGELPLRKGRVEEPALVPVMEGCDQFCTYCVVPYGRGPVRSRPHGEITDEIKNLVKNGHKEVTLLGQSINDYGVQSAKGKVQKSFVALLKEIHNIAGLEKILILSPNPWNFPDELIEVLALPKFERYIHLPVQSGDNEVLKKMNRPYRVEDYKKLVRKIRQKIPGVRIGTDAIVGFPGETEKQFQNTAKLFEELKFDAAYIAMYSERPGTAAAKIYKDDIPLLEKKSRHQLLTRIWKRAKIKKGLALQTA